MFSLPTVVAALALQAATVFGKPAPQVFRCGTEAPSPALVDAASRFQAEAATFDPDTVRARALVVDTYFHIVSSQASSNVISSSQVAAQLERMNTAYGASGVSFNLISTDRTINNAWSTGNSNGPMKRALRKGSYNDLNVYFLSDLGGGLLGQCTFPTNSATPGSAAFIDDGCLVASGTVPGGNISNYDGGSTAVHEAGHWFGLFHVFQGQACTGSGDFVSDTPLQRTPTSGCPASKDSCPNSAGADSINNYMDYSYDRCFTQFTPGQTTRLFQIWDAYRAGK
ncbi:MAG: hypothetical protein M1817_003948 [Caeruleum heppii]|nr:MAG: hypothetical protein M1817_003948 [Caeruleum heppii]